MAIDWDKEVLAPVMQVFGEDLLPLYAPRDGAPFLLSCAVFDSEYLEISDMSGDTAGQSTQRPVLGVRLSLFASPPAQNDTVTIPSTGKTYVVRDVQPDGHGHAKLMLMETS